jgi:ribosomal protein L15
LHRRIPKLKKVSRGHKHISFTPVKLEKLNFIPPEFVNSPVTFKSLVDCGATTRSKNKFWKLVGGGELKQKKLVIHAYAFSSSARKAIEDSGGECVVLSRTRHKPVVEDPVDLGSDDGIVDVEVL